MIFFVLTYELLMSLRRCNKKLEKLPKLEISEWCVLGVRTEKSRPLKRARLANQILILQASKDQVSLPPPCFLSFEYGGCALTFVGTASFRFGFPQATMISFNERPCPFRAWPKFIHTYGSFFFVLSNTLPKVVIFGIRSIKHEDKKMIFVFI